MRINEGETFLCPRLDLQLKINVLTDSWWMWLFYPRSQYLKQIKENDKTREDKRKEKQWAMSVLYL